MKDQIQRAIDDSKQDLLNLSHNIHQNPEIRFQEEKACKWQVDLLKAHGFHIETPFAGLATSYKAVMSGKGKGPRVAFLAEYDALENIGHGCGHNLIAAMSVGAAIGLSKFIKQLDGEIIVFGCPAEESGKGKVIMINNGGFTNIDFAMMVHPSNRNLIGRLGLAACVLDVEFIGKAAHSKEPAEGINALAAIIQIFNGIDMQRQKWTDDAKINGIITSGGTAPNIIPDYAAARFTVRAKTSGYLLKMLKDINNVVNAAALITGAQPKFKSGLISTERYPNSVMERVFKKNMEIVGETMSYPPKGLSAGSSDFGNVSMIIPAIHEYVAIAPTCVKNHTKEFAEAAISEKSDEMLLKGAKGLAMTAYDILVNQELRENIRSEFEATVAQKK
ncbi:MAG: M20 family metallopeptidase [Veillonellales bacterium]